MRPPHSLFDKDSFGLDNLQLNGNEVLKNDKFKEKLKQHLLSQGLIVGTGDTELGHGFSSAEEHARLEAIKLQLSSKEVLDHSLRVSKEAIATCGLWQLNNGARTGCKLIMSDIPMALHKFNLACSMHLQEMEALFEQLVYEASGNADTLYQGALGACPDLVLHHSDEYMACMIN